ncbi:MMPL family transporter [Patulibacter minatonensis]|uniref:MMPL family transporter n=1 Tax=Patulibacter minatonensis TaxID=298163 RepID=UPI001FDF6E7A|nr:MMPL family transporter [Patulibacter minatonensis]
MTLWVLLVVGCTAAGVLTGTKTLTEAENGVGESGRAAVRLDDAGLRAPAVETILVRSASAAATADAARELQTRAARLGDVASVQGVGARGASTDGGRSVLVRATLRGDPEDAADHVGPLTDAVAAVAREHAGTRLLQSGAGTLQHEFDDVVASDMQKAEVYSIPITLAVLVVAFGALVAASVPLLLGVTAVAGAMGALGVVSQLAPSGDTTGTMVVLIGLAVGVDYSLFYVRREREERRRGHHADAALRAASASVGRAIVVSGITVMVAMAGLLLTGVAAFTSMALGTTLVVLIALLGSLTVLPAVLALLGDRVDKGRIPFAGRLRARREARIRAGRPVRRTVWQVVAGTVTRRPGVSLVTAGAVLLALAAPAIDMKTADPGLASLPKDSQVAAAQRTIDRAFPGAPDDAQLVVTGRGLDRPDARRGLEALGARGERVTDGRGPVTVRVSRDGRTALVAVPMPDRGIDAGRDTVRELRSQVAPTATRIGPGTEVLVAGDAASSLDFDHVITSKLPLVIGFVLGLAFVLLLAAFRSVRLAATVVLLNLLSVGAAYGVVTAVFQNTWAEDLLGFTSSGTVVPFFPLLAFVILFGLSMDYSVLVLERIREARDAGRSPRDAAAEGVAATAGSVTSAAAVMVAVFAIFAVLRLLEMKQMGVGLSAAVLIDATIVRAVALPAAVALLGERGFGRRRGDRLPRRIRPVVPEAWDDGRRAPSGARPLTPMSADAPTTTLDRRVR